jgi:hypothetical protein
MGDIEGVDLIRRCAISASRPGGRNKLYCVQVNKSTAKKEKYGSR